MTFKEYAKKLGGYDRILLDKENLFYVNNKYKSFATCLEYYVATWYPPFYDYWVIDFSLVEGNEIKVKLRGPSGAEATFYIDENYAIPGGKG